MLPKLIKFQIFFTFVSSIFSQNCPKFQSAVKLNSSAIASNLSFAIIADGKYYLIASEEEYERSLEPTGDMPHGFRDSRATIVIDRLNCNHSQYYLLTLETLLKNDSNWITYYTTLDLLNWNRTTQWSEPKPVSKYPMLANDPYFTLMSMFEPNFYISKFVKTMLYWEEKKTIFIVINFFQKTDLKSLRYYTIDMSNACEENFTYSKNAKDFASALTSFENPLDFCFINDGIDGSNSLLYCFGGDRFQVNEMNSQFSQNTGLQTKLIEFPDVSGSLTTDRLPIFERICQNGETGHESGIRLRIHGRKAKKPNPENIKTPVTQWEDSIRTTIEDNSGSVTTVKIEEDSSSVVLITIILCLIIIFIVLLVVLIVNARKRSAIARM